MIKINLVPAEILAKAQQKQKALQFVLGRRSSASLRRSSKATNCFSNSGSRAACRCAACMSRSSVTIRELTSVIFLDTGSQKNLK